MAKRERGRRALQDEVGRRIQQIDEIGEDGARIRVPAPQPHARDARGRNWDMAFDNLHGYAASVRAVVDKVRDEFDLNEALENRTPNPFGD
ncbi:hypothetical protein VSR17_20905 [Cupriavidus taiwanensis]|uniref:Uncharacterized protein n=1 Tax=Cupriavidus taiwanensis TaxID=164546 RepID=A0A375H0A1_9BURK|nr:hypothetical protein [Cupriavidus taiwanensis]SOY43438.1 conserved hypothetical protein [Cupriavidus taiwanensis]SOY45920.1 conserved hypothetical protein [Cupriavidus taiwanensis]SOY81377.1 conserved hypothetical protein [Cupriavidus taiwanensis]SOZ22654.1 conserved hypothetical protein [Cupriavidus taiwanensis]SOZ54430.1 conserved hypothetical protein [Cupriavidus taiwanensis]